MIPLAKNIKRLITFKEAVIVALAVIFSISAGFGVFTYLKKDVVISCDGRKIAVTTMKSTVQEALEQNNITVASEDFISMPLDAKLQRTTVNEINIKRAVPVKILADGKEIQLMTYRDTLEEALADSPVKPYGQDRIEGASLSSKIVKDMTVKIIRVKEEIMTEEESIPFETVTKKNSSLDSGVEKVVRNGQEGILEKQYKVVTEDGVEIARELIKETVVLSPVNALIDIGTVLSHKTSRGDILRYSKVLDVRATAYTASFKDTGKHPDHPEFGITRTGIRAKKGVIAVDPRVIPLGTRVYVEIAGNTADYGYAVAADTGGAIKGNKIDLYFDDQDFVDRWGVKKAKVYILLNE